MSSTQLSTEADDQTVEASTNDRDGQMSLAPYFTDMHVNGNYSTSTLPLFPNTNLPVQIRQYPADPLYSIPVLSQSTDQVTSSMNNQ